MNPSPLFWWGEFPQYYKRDASLLLVSVVVDDRDLFPIFLSHPRANVHHEGKRCLELIAF